MRTRLLFFVLLMVTGLLNAQDTIRTLVISEVRLDDARESYIEIANVGTTTLNLKDFQIGNVTPWNTPKEAGNLVKGWNVDAGASYRLPDKELAPGETFVIASLYDWNPRAWAKDPTKGTRVMNKKEFWTLADIQAHFTESPVADATDSVNVWWNLLDTWGGRDCYYIAYYLSPTDSVVTDIFNGFEYDTDGTRHESALDVAGFTNATSQATLVRKYSVKKGNLDFLSAAGQDLEESEWMPIPHQFGGWEQFRALYWTVKNHGDYNLDETTLTSSTVDIDWDNETLTVPWGVRRDDSLIFQFDKHPGLAWHHSYVNNKEDSMYFSLRTGDIFTIYACGNDLDKIDFEVIVSPPTADANIVVPKKFADEDGYYSGWPPTWVVTDKNPVMDTIMEIPFGIRVDTLLKYLEKAPNASWEIEWVDGNVRTDIMKGDILKVTAESGAVKRYYIKPDKYQKSHDAYISMITWPDIPEDYKGLYGWVGDTIPSFVYTKTSYKVQVPYDVQGIPALVAQTRDINSKLEVSRATNLAGSEADRTVSFSCTAEDDTSILVYNILLEKEKDFANIQPWQGEPFISQYVFRSDYANPFVEVVNPGTEPLDMSNYMLVFGYNGTTADAITSNSGTGNWAYRYRKYIPGYKWQSQAEWETQPRIAVQDIAVNPLVQPGDVFVVAEVRSGETAAGYPPATVIAGIDIDFAHNPWDEAIGDWTSLQDWWGAKIFLFKILNDSVKLGTKPATDPNDFEVIDVLGNSGDRWIVGGIPMDQCFAYSRKPEVYKGNPEIGASFGTTEDDSEWIMVNEARLQAAGYPWPAWRYLVADGIGAHFMKDVTVYKSTVTSSLYKVSEGYTTEELIKGVVEGTTVEEFYAGINKADEGQTFKVMRGATEVAATAELEDGDVLEVLSADGNNTTMYELDVTAGGLSNDAVLVSDDYTIDVTGSTGTVSGFDYTVTLREVFDGVTVPEGASINVINGDDAYVPFVMLNFDTTQVDVLVSADVYFEVIAENGTSKILYQLMPEMMNNGAFVTSSVFDIDQELSLINFVPEGTAVYGLMKYLVPAPGATVILVDKLGYERTTGEVYQDDRIVVTSEDGETTKIYYLQVLDERAAYLAYVVSEVYNVDQLELNITGNFSVLTSITSFLGNLTASPDATLAVTNAAGAVQSGNLEVGDLLVVTAGDGVTTATYTLEVGTSIGKTNLNSISVYPNPSAGLIYVSGLETGNTVCVTNMVGQRIIDREVRQSKETFNLEGNPAGLYFITVKNGKEIVGHYKMVLQ